MHTVTIAQLENFKGVIFTVFADQYLGTKNICSKFSFSINCNTVGRTVNPN